MADHRTRSGSLQYYPRKRVRKILPSVNWGNIEARSDAKGFLGLIGYKVGMVSVYAKDMTEDSMTKSKRVVIPGTILECPVMKIYCVRFHKYKQIVKDIVVSNEKDLKRKVKVCKTIKDFDKEVPEDYDDVSVIVYSVNKTKKPDMVELGIGGGKEDKLKLVKEKIGKDILVSDVLQEGLVDVRGTTKGKGLQGPVKRFGITLKAKKSEKGQRRPGSLAPWNPARVTFRAPQAGQLGMFSRTAHNNIILKIGKISEKDINKKSGFHKYGTIKNDYIILKGSVPGPRKRVLLLTKSFRGSRRTAKQNFEVVELR